MTEPPHDVAHVGHAELLAPRPDESLHFFERVLGMEVEARVGQSVSLWAAAPASSASTT